MHIYEALENTNLICSNRNQINDFLKSGMGIGNSLENSSKELFGVMDMFYFSVIHMFYISAIYGGNVS